MKDLSQPVGIRVEDPLQRTAGFSAWLTVERAGYAITLLLALTLRLLGLGALPPNPDEAAHALLALAAARGLPPGGEMAGASPMLFHVQRVTLALFAASSFALRFWPALLGGLSVLLFYAFRRRIGPGGALMAAFLWAISPLAIFISRLALGDAFVAPLALACAASFEMLWSAGAAAGRIYAVLAAVTLALLLLSGPNAYTVLLAAVLATLIWREAARGLWRAMQPVAKAAGLAFLLTLVLGATLGFSAPQGLAAAFELPGRWAALHLALHSQALIPRAGEYGALELLGRLVMNEALIVGLSIAGLIVAARRHYAFGLAAAFFALTALLVAMIGNGRRPPDLTLVILPLTFLAGPVAARIASDFLAWGADLPYGSRLDSWLMALVNVVLLLAAAFCLPGAFNPSNTATWRHIYLAVGAVTLGLAVLQWIVYGIWGNVGTVGRVLPFVLLVLGVFWTLSQTVGVNLDHGAWRRAGVLHDTTGASYRDLERSLSDLAALRGKGKREVPVDLILTPGKDEAVEPVLRWLLRDYPMVQQSAALPFRPAPVVITVAEEQPALESAYSGAEFGLLEHWQPAMLPNAYARLRWVLFRETFAPPDVKGVILWVRGPETSSGEAPGVDLVAPTEGPGAAP